VAVETAVISRSWRDAEAQFPSLEKEGRGVVEPRATTPTPLPSEEGSHSHGCEGSGSADPRVWGPRFFRGTIDKPRTPNPGAVLIWS